MEESVTECWATSVSSTGIVCFLGAFSCVSTEILIGEWLWRTQRAISKALTTVKALWWRYPCGAETCRMLCACKAGFMSWLKTKYLMCHSKHARKQQMQSVGRRHRPSTLTGRQSYRLVFGRNLVRSLGQIAIYLRFNGHFLDLSPRKFRTVP